MSRQSKAKKPNAELRCSCRKIMWICEAMVYKLACIKGKTATVEMMMNNANNYKLDLLAEDNEYKNGFQLAIEFQKTDVVNLLKRKIPSIAFWHKLPYVNIDFWNIKCPSFLCDYSFTAFVQNIFWLYCCTKSKISEFVTTILKLSRLRPARISCVRLPPIYLGPRQLQFVPLKFYIWGYRYKKTMGVTPLCYYLIERLKKWTNGHTGKIVENSVLFYYYLVSTKVRTAAKKK